MASVRAPSDTKPNERIVAETTFDPGPIGSPMTAMITVGGPDSEKGGNDSSPP
jgi:hypothetical protein